MQPLTQSQQQALEDLSYGEAISANDFNRHALEALVKKGLAIKHHLGRMVTYTRSK